MGYTRLGESEIRLFQIPVQDIVDFPLVAGTYRYIESVIVVHAQGTYRCLEVWGNNDQTTTVGMVAGMSTPPRTWLPPHMAEKTEPFTYELFPCSIVLYEWKWLDKSPPFVRWSGMFHGVPLSALRHDVSRIAIGHKKGFSLLYAPGMANPPSSFRDPATVAPTFRDPATVAPATGTSDKGLPDRPGPGSSDRDPVALAAPTTTVTTVTSRPDLDPVALAGVIVVSISAVALLVVILVTASRQRRYEGAYSSSSKTKRN